MNAAPRHLVRLTARSVRAARAAARASGAAALEGLVRMAAARAPAPPAAAPESPRAIFVLRNNDVGDLLVVTPLFDALRRRFPGAEIVAGVGRWNLDVLRGNPHLSGVLPVNAPWFNKYQDAAGPLGRWAYLQRSPEVAAVRQRGFDVGIDVLGSAWGSLLLLRAGIPYRLGVAGYAGGDTAAQAVVRFDPRRHVGRSALGFAELLGATDLPENRPQVFLAPQELEAAERRWSAAERAGRRQRILVAPGGGLAAKRWPAERFAALVAGLAALPGVSLMIAGGPGEEELTAQAAAGAPGAVTFPGAPSLREAFALIAASDLVVCNSSMPLHAAAAFRKPALALLGEAFVSTSQHQSQWGYPEARSLGREPGVRSDLATVEEALAAVGERLGALAPAD